MQRYDWLYFGLAVFVCFNFTNGQTDFYSWLETIKNTEIEEDPRPDSCQWETPPENGYQFKRCDAGACVKDKGSFVSNGTTRVTVCKKHFTLTRGSDKDLCIEGSWTSSGHECIPCGRSSSPMAPGQPSWHANLYTAINNQWELVCRATLISSQLVLAASHCLIKTGSVIDLRTAFDLDLDENLKIVLGREIDKLDLNETSPPTFSVKEIIMPEGYNSTINPFAQDLALFVLSEPAKMDSNIMPACLDWKEAFPKPMDGEDSYVTLWNSKGSGSNNDSTQWSSRKLLSHFSCANLLDPKDKPLLTEDKFCVEELKGITPNLSDTFGGITFIRDGAHYLHGVYNNKLLGRKKDLLLFTSFLLDEEHRSWLQGHWRRVHSQQRKEKTDEEESCSSNKDCSAEKACSESVCINPCVNVCGENCTCEVIRHRPVCACLPRDPGTQIQLSSHDKVVATTPSYDQEPGDVCKQSGQDLWTCQRLSECSKAVADQVEGKDIPLCNNKQSADNPLVCCEPFFQAPIQEQLNKMVCRRFAQLVYTQITTTDNNNLILSDSCAIYDEPLDYGEFSSLKHEENLHMALVSGNNFKNWCYGNLISENFFLTNAVCPVTNGPLTKARLGERKWLKNINENDIYDVAETIVHPKYTVSATYNSLALLKLNRTVDFSLHIRPICLHSEHLFPGTYILQTGKLYGLIQKENVTVLTKKECDKIFLGAELLDGVVDESLFCTQGESPLSYFAGLPLQIALTEPYCMYGLVGVNAYGFPDNGTIQPVLNTRISYFLPWIESIVWPS